MRSSRLAQNDMIGYGIHSFDSMDDELMLDSSCGSSDEDTIDDDIVLMMNNTEKRKQKLRIERQNSDEVKETNAKAIVAGVATGALSLVLGGPIAGALVALGTAYVAKIDTMTPIGDVARSVGGIITSVATEVDTKHLHISSNVKNLNEKLQVTEKSSAIIEKTKETIVTVNQQHQITEKVGTVVGGVANTTQNVFRNFNEKHDVTDKLKGIWNCFEKNILLTEDTLEFEKQIQYIIMERTLEEEEIQYQQQLMKSMVQQQQQQKSKKQRSMIVARA